jgi:hypothetical protein
MGRYRRGLLITTCGLTLSGSSLWAEPVTKGQAPVSVIDRFSGRLSVGRKIGKEFVAYKVLSLAPGTSVAVPPPPKVGGGFTLYELRAGKLTTIIDGERQRRREGEFWVVGPRQNIIFETDDDSVVVHTIQISDF